MTGARLLFANTTIQHAGLTLDQNDLTHVFAGAVQSDGGPFAALLVNRECSGLTAACVALRREVFDEVGGLCEALPINFNDVDLSCKLRHLGYRLVWVANATAYHFESQTRVPVVHKWESDLIAKRWALPDDDPYLPGLSPRRTVRNRRFGRNRRRRR